MGTPKSRKLFASDVTRFSDAELDRYLEANGRCILVDDPENLSDQFIQRLRVRAGVGDSLSRSIDLNYVSARLNDNRLDEDEERLPRSPSLATTISMDKEEEDQWRQDQEREAYNKLINDGGRPSHPITLKWDIAKNLEEYREILSFWQFGRDNWMVFGSQWGNWQQFRQHQRSVRSGDFPAFCQLEYERLKKHSVQCPFRLNYNPDRQDKLTTWIEFLSYEYWKHDKSADIVIRRQSQYDEAWKKLVDSKVLQPLETADSLDYFLMLQLKHEKAGAQNAVESATLSVDKELAAAASGSSVRALATAKSKLDIAMKSLEQSTYRHELIGDFIDRTKSYRIAKENASHSSLLLSWMLNQIPLIETESKPVMGLEKRKLKRNLADDCSEDTGSKRQRREASYTFQESSTFTQDARAAKTSVVLGARRVRRLKRDIKFNVDDTLEVQGLRRSTRLKRRPETLQ